MSKKILIINGPGYARALNGLGECVTDVAEFIKAPETFKLVMFTGGEDVSAELYGHTSPKRLCGSSIRRDTQEQVIFEAALAAGIPMVGICRGSQFLNVMSGGTMIHHLDNHGTDHTMRTNDDRVIMVTSTHHQMSKPSDEGYVLAWSDTKRSGIYYGDGDVVEDYTGPEVEAIYYPKTKVFAVQYHPEYMSMDSEGYEWFRTGADDLMTLSEDQFKVKYLAEEKSVSV